MIKKESSITAQKDLEFTLNLLEEIVSCPTTHPKSGAHIKCIEFIKAKLQAIGFEIIIKEATNDTDDEDGDVGPILYATLNGTKSSNGPHIHFNGHYDVVPVGTGWNTNPFQLTKIDDTLVGRGTADMKGGIATAIGAIRKFLLSTNFQKGKISISIVPDEERGGKFGTGYLLKQGIPRPDLVIQPETSLPFVYIGHRGVLQWMVTVTGKAAHAGTPAKGNNAFLKGVSIVGSILQAHQTYLESVFSNKATYGVPTIVLGGITSSGKAINIVPEQFSFSVDRRVVIEEQTEDVIKWFNTWLETTDNQIISTLVNKVEPWLLDVANILIKSTIDKILDTTNDSVQIEYMKGFADMWYFDQQLEVPGLIFGPGRIGEPHTANEKIYISDIQMVHDCYLNILSSFFDDADN